MANGGFIEIIKLIEDGELVRAAIANRAPVQNDQNVRYLRDLFEAAMLGETIFARNRTVEIDAKVGQALYYNPTSQKFERALGNVQVDDETGLIEMSTSSQVWGVIYRKLSDTKADILLHGVADLDLSQAIDGDPEFGKVYYLSNTSAGKLTTARPPVGVSVLQVAGESTSGDDTYTVYVNTKFSDLLEAHRHYKFELVSEPAGETSPPTPGGRHTITSPDVNKEGWLPAGHAIFAGNAPPNAVFGYNISASSLANIWPPLPLASVSLEWSKGADKDLLGMLVPLGSDQLALINRDGIWWLSDCYDDVPWPVTLDTSAPDSISDSESSAECPRFLFPQMLLWFSKPIFHTAGTSVLSLTGSTGIRFVCTDDPAQEKTAGHLQALIDLSLLLGDSDRAGYVAMKTLDEDGVIHRGPIVESIKAGTSNVTLSSEASTDGKYVGNVIVSVSSDLEGGEVSIDTVRLDGVEEEFYQDTIALGFPAGRAAEFRGRLLIPAGITVPVGTKLKLRFWVLNRSTLDVPQDIFSLSYRRITMPSTVETPQALPTSAAEVVLGSLPAADVGVSSTADLYFTIESDEFTIAAGDIVLFTLTRQGNTDGYSGDLHLLRQRGVYVGAV